MAKEQEMDAPDNMLDYLKLSQDSTNMAKPSKDYAARRKELDYRLNELKNALSPWLPQFAEIARYLLPQFGKYISNPRNTTKGLLSKIDILNSDPVQALLTLASGLLGGLSSQNKPWFRLATPSEIQDDDQTKVWLEAVVDRMRSAMDKSGIYEEFWTTYCSAASFGTHAMIIYEDQKNMFRCENIPIGQFMLSADDRGEVTTLFREFNLTLYQMVKRYGVENLSLQAQSLWENKQGYETEYTLCQAIYPYEDYNPEGKGKEKWEYVDITWEVGGDNTNILEERGFREKPFVSPRWSRLNGVDVYGDSPAMTALNDIKMLQELTASHLKALGKMEAPPLLAPSHLKDQPSVLIPNGITYTTDVVSGRMMPVYEVPYQVSSVLRAEIDVVTARIQQVFHRDLWMLLSSMEGVQPRSAMELMQRQGEKLLQLSPTLQRMQAELLSPAIERIFSIMFRRGAFPPPPPAVVELIERGMGDLKVEYVSELSVAQNARDTIPIEQFMSFIGNLSAVFPEARDKINVDEAIDDYGPSLGVSPKLINPTKQANEVRNARNQQMQQQQMMEQGLAMAQGAKTLSETQVGGGANALAMMTGGGM